MIYSVYYDTRCLYAGTDRKRANLVARTVSETVKLARVSASVMLTEDNVIVSLHHFADGRPVTRRSVTRIA